MPPRIVLGTRGSRLALWQASKVARLLGEAHPGIVVETRIVSTDGDLAPDDPVVELGERGVFVRQLERELGAGTIDAAVHSLKDMPARLPDGCALGAVPHRHDPRDALVSLEGFDLDGLPRGAVVGTGSPRRRSALLHARPDLRIVPVRGNVDTRVQRLAEGRLDALVLALAGVERLGLAGVSCVPLPASRCLPAAGQGAIGVEVREGDEATRSLVGPLDHPSTSACCRAERAFLSELGGGCLAPATCHATIADGRMLVEAVVGDPDGRVLLWEREIGVPEEGLRIGARIARRLRRAGAAELLARAREPRTS
jgi:hydroxymethylbilane synthase